MIAMHFNDRELKQFVQIQLGPFYLRGDQGKNKKSWGDLERGVAKFVL